MSEIASFARQPFAMAEFQYRAERARRTFQRPTKPRRWVPRRPTLKLPPPRRRPLAVA